MKTQKLLLLIFFLNTTYLIFSQPYKNPNIHIEKRINDLLSRMTLKEKIGQMQQYNFWKLDDATLKKVTEGKVGSFLNASNKKDKIKLQKAAIEKSRLGIPLIFGRDVIHGYKTILPIPLGEAATWNPELVKKGAEIAAQEATENNINWTFAPMIDIARDPRWGRIAESCGEDPFLAGTIGAAMIKGFQGNNLNDNSTIAACAKHYVGYGAAEGGRDYNTTLIPERELRNVYLKTFQTAVNSGVATLMSAFNDLNGVPASGNKFTLKKILRNEWNFNGFVVSDWEAISEMIKHGFAKDGNEAAFKAVDAGVNMEMVSENYANYLEKLINSHKVNGRWIDTLVAGILRIKFKLGLFDTPINSKPVSEFLPAQNKQIAKSIATESIVMLQNKNNTLPLKVSEINSLAVIGPLANSPKAQMGTWTLDGNPKDVITPLNAIKSEYGKKLKIYYSKAMESPRSTNKKLFKKAIQTAKKSDAVLLFLGEDEELSGETHCRAFLNLPGAQENLIIKLSKLNKPLILIIMAGRPLTFGNITNKVNSILYAWHPGTMGGEAISDIIFGKTSPSGKLPVTFPRTVGQIPLYYNHKNTGRPPSPNQLGRVLGTPVNPKGYASYYLDVDYTPAYYFGYGESYSSFNYSDLTLSKKIIDFNDTLKVSVIVKNTGKYKAKETIQLYIRDLYASVTRPVKELKRFKKAEFIPGETKTIHFKLTVDDFKFYDINMKYNAEPGDFVLFVGSSANDKDLLKSNFTLTKY